MSKLVIIIIFKKVKKLTVEIKIGEIFTDQNSLQIKLLVIWHHHYSELVWMQ